MGELLLEALTPVTLEVALSVQQQIQSRIDEADRLRQRQVERARYETDMARRRYMAVDPANRLVADSLEADWNEKLRALAQAQQEYERQSQEDRMAIGAEQRASILSLASDFPRLWRDPQTPDRERKRMVRLLIEDVTLLQGEAITAHVRFKGGATHTLTLPRPMTWAKRHRTSADVVAEIDRLIEHHTARQIAAILNARGFQSGFNQAFEASHIWYLADAYGLKRREARLREAGMLTLQEVAKRLRIDRRSVTQRRLDGTIGLRVERLDDNGRYMYEDPDRAPVTGQRPVPATQEEVQYET